MAGSTVKNCILVGVEMAWDNTYSWAYQKGKNKQGDVKLLTKIPWNFLSPNRKHTVALHHCIFFLIFINVQKYTNNHWFFADISNLVHVAKLHCSHETCHTEEGYVWMAMQNFWNRLAIQQCYLFFLNIQFIYFHIYLFNYLFNFGTFSPS